MKFTYISSLVSIGAAIAPAGVVAQRLNGAAAAAPQNQTRPLNPGQPPFAAQNQSRPLLAGNQSQPITNGASWATIPSIQAYGQHFFYSNNGSQFFLKGVAYQQNFQPNGTTQSVTNGGAKFTDPLSDAASCARDIPVMKQIFTNVIRVYSIDPKLSHDDCMQQLAANDIYVIADLGAPGDGSSINSDAPAWTAELLARYTSVVDALAKYNNVIGFFAGNEVVLNANQTAAAAFVKASVRDTKSYIRSKGYRASLGVGYATADVPTRNDLAHYFACDPEGKGGNATSIDFWGYNVYSWCGFSNFQASAYDERVKFFQDYPVPVFFAEYGCNTGIPSPTERPFTEVAALYGSNMTSVFSGGIVYEWFMAENEFGLVNVEGDKVSPLPDFTSLMKQLAAATPSPTPLAQYTPQNTPPACPTAAGTWTPQASPLPPVVDVQACSCMVQSLECMVKSTNATAYGAVFDYICSQNPQACGGIMHDSTTGQYGAVSGCSAQQQLSYVVNQYYVNTGKKLSSCDFGGLAVVQSAAVAAECTAPVSAIDSAPMPTPVVPLNAATGVPDLSGAATPDAAGAGSGAQATGVPAQAAAASAGVSTKPSNGTIAGSNPGSAATSLFDFGPFFLGTYVVLAVVSSVGLMAL